MGASIRDLALKVRVVRPILGSFLMPVGNEEKKEERKEKKRKKERRKGGKDQKINCAPAAF